MGNKLDGKDLLIKELKDKIECLDKENECLRNMLESKTLECDDLEYHLKEIRNSFSYKLGFALTTIPRKIRK